MTTPVGGIAATYYGHPIYRMRTNSMGCRYESFVGRLLTADTLDGMRDLIRHHRLLNGLPVRSKS